jgi:ABC-type branched-subunit amino acid transport system substrate-binding protein
VPELLIPPPRMSTFASEAERLILQDRVAATFGCWTSASRKHVKPIVERRRQAFTEMIPAS